jgi:hypothetical protein
VKRKEKTQTHGEKADISGKIKRTAGFLLNFYSA